MVKGIDKTRAITRSRRTPFQWAGWLIRFSQYGSCPARERQALLRDAREFPQTAYVRDLMAPAPTDKQARALALTVNAALRHCAHGTRWYVPYKIEHGSVPPTLCAEPGLPLIYMSNSFTTAFLIQVAKLISTAGRSIRECAAPRCDKLFAVLRNGAFCSRPCAQKVHTATWRARKQERKFAKVIKGMDPAKTAQLIERERKRQAKKAERQEAERLKLNAQLARAAGMVQPDTKLDPAEAERWQRQGDLTAPLRKPT